MHSVTLFAFDIFSIGAAVFTYTIRQFKGICSQILPHIITVITSLSTRHNLSVSLSLSFFALQALFKLFYNQLDPTATPSPSPSAHPLLIGSFENVHNTYVYCTFLNFTMCACVHTSLFARSARACARAHVLNFAERRSHSQRCLIKLCAELRQNFDTQNTVSLH